ncbi:MAG: hypothetical protein ACOX7N_09095 [Lawsonibacter sp.]|jgi:hypothetical protein
MRPESTDATNQRALRWQAIRGAVSYCLIQLVGALLLFALRGVIQGWMDTLLLVLAVLDLAAIPPVFWVLKERIKEIKGGELDVARKY